MTLKPKQLIAGILAGAFTAWVLWSLGLDLFTWILVVILAILLLIFVISGSLVGELAEKEIGRIGLKSTQE